MGACYLVLLLEYSYRIVAHCATEQFHPGLIRPQPSSAILILIRGSHNTSDR